MDESPPPFEPSPELRELWDRKWAELEEEFGPLPDKEPPPSYIHWPQLTPRIHEEARLWYWSRTQPLVEIGRFGALKLIGEGGFGAVYKAFDPELDRYVAIKLCPIRRPGTEEALKLEAKALARLKHPNIITVHDVGFGRFEDRDAFFIVTEFIEAVSLRDYAPEPDGQGPLEELLDIFACVGEALVTAHEAGVVHGDIKPANIILDTHTRQPTIIDFGLAHIVAKDVETIERNHGGTLPYMAPELLRHRGARDPRTDQYAFCVSLWRCLDGRCPYVGRNTEELLADVEIGAPDAVYEALLPEPLREVLLVGLREDPEARFADMRALLDALARVRGPRLVEDVVCVEPQEPAASPAAAPRRLAFVKGGAVGLAFVLGTAALLRGEGVAERTSSVSESVSEDPGESVGEDEDPTASALEGFAAAQRALDAGDVQGCYDEWKEAYPKFKEGDPTRAGELSLELANNLDSVQPGRLTSAWMTAGAAEAYQQAAAAEQHSVKKSLMWHRAAKARERAVELYRAADAPENVIDQDNCRVKNEKQQPCVESRLTSDD